MNVYIKNKTRKVQKSILLVLMLLISLMPVNVMAENNSPVDTIKASRDINDEKIYFLERCSSSNLNIGDEIAWLDSSYTETEFTSVGVPSNSGIVEIVKKPEPSDGDNYWKAYYPEQVNFYLDVLKSGKGFDGCIHGTLNHEVTEYNCWRGGVKHLKGTAYTYISKPFYSKVTFNLNINGAPASGKKVQLYDGNDYFDLTDKGNGVYSSSEIFIGDYSIYVNDEPVNLGVSVKKTLADDGYLCTINDAGEYVRNNDKTEATAYYSGHEYTVNGNFYNYKISALNNNTPTDEFGKISFVGKDHVYSLDKTDVGTYQGVLSLPIDITSEDISIYLGNVKTDAVFQTTRNIGDDYKNNDIKISFYTAEVTASLDDNPMSGYTVSFDNGIEQYYGKTDDLGIATLTVKQKQGDTAELPYNVKIEGTVDNTNNPITISSSNKEVNLNYYTVSFYKVEKGESKSFLKQYVRDGSKPNKVANAQMEGYAFDFWSERPWTKDEDSSNITKYDFTNTITRKTDVYAHVTKPTLDIYNTYIGTDIKGELVSDGSASAFRMPAVTITGFPKGDVLKCFNLELTNIDKVYFYKTTGLEISQTGGATPTDEVNGGKSTTASKVTVSFPEKASMTWVENYIRENVVFVPKSGETVKIKLTVSDDVISVESTSTIEQNPCTTVVGTKLTSGDGVVLGQGSYYIDDDVTLTGKAPVYTTDNTNDVAHPGITIQGDVCIFIPSGKTLTVKGSDAAIAYYNGSTSSGHKLFPGAAGILLEEGNTLYIYGGGKVKAIGGAAGAGGDGGTPSFYSYQGSYDGTWNYRPSSGQGGYGGGGAGAGIGTNGANPQYAAINYQAFQGGGGGAGQNGENGRDAVAVTTQMGSLYVAESIHLEAKGGAASSTVGKGGAASSTEIKTTPYTSNNAQVGGCGGGGGGYGGHAAANIGKGGAAGATGGTGGTGGFRSNYGQGGGGKGANGNNGGGTKTNNGGTGGNAGNDTIANPAEQTYGPAQQTPNHLTSSIEFENSGSEATTFNFVTGGGIIVPGFTNVESGTQFLGWKVKTYGKTFGTAGVDNPLTTAESKLYQPGDMIQLQPYTYGDIVMAPVVEPLPANAASDTLTLTTLGSSQLYEYTLKVTNKGQAADLGTFVFHGSDGKNYNVNSTKDEIGTYILTLTKDITISSITAKDLNNITIKDGDNNITIDDGGIKQAAFNSIEVAIKGKTVGEVKVKDSSNTIPLTFNSVLSTNDTAVFSYFTQGNGDSKDYTIVVDGEEIPTATAKFGTRATIDYSTVNVTLNTNVNDALNLYLKDENNNKISLEKNGELYSVTHLSDGIEYTLFINDYNTNETITLSQSIIEITVDYYEINIVSKVDGAVHETDHEIKVNDIKATTFDNTNFKAIALSTNNCAITSNGVNVQTITPSKDLGVTYVDYYTVKYQLGANCSGTPPVDDTLYIKNQYLVLKGAEDLNTTTQNSYVAGWTVGDDNTILYKGDKYYIYGPTIFTSAIKTEDLIIHFVDHVGEVARVSKLPLKDKIVIPEIEGLHSTYTEGDITYSFVGWKLAGNYVNPPIYSPYEETTYIPEAILSGEATKEITFNAVYSLSKNPFSVTGTYTYDGTAKIPTLEDGSFVMGTDYDIVFDNNTDHTSAGENILFKVVLKGKYYGEYDMSFNIGKCPITITPDSNQNKTYGENDPTLTYTITSGSLYGSDALNGSLSRESGENVGEYIITIGSLNNSNYEIELIPVKFIINKKTLTTGLTITGTYTYSGEGIIPSYTVKDGNITLEKDVDYDEELLNNIDASSTEPTVKITLKGNYDGILTGTFVIGKASITPTVSLTNWAYGEIANEPSVTGNKGNGTVTYKYKVNGSDDSEYTTDVPTNAGLYIVKAEISETANYLSGSTETEFAINKAVITPIVLLDSWTYGEAASTPSVDGNLGNGTVAYKYKVKNADDSTYSETKPSNIGNYLVKAEISETDNYLPGVSTCEFNIFNSSTTKDGNIETATLNTNENIEEIKLDPISKENALIIVDAEDDLKQAIIDGKNLIIYTEVENPSDESKSAFTSLNIDETNAIILDINLYGEIKGEANSKKKITDTNGYKTTISITLTPEQAAKINIANNKNYFVLRQHADVIEKIPAILAIDANNNYVFTFETDKFSAYAIYSENKPSNPYTPPNTGIEGNNYPLLKLSSLSLLAIGTYLVIKKKKDN